METKHKTFKPFEKVLIRFTNRWICDLYSHYNNEKSCHAVISGTGIKDDNILPYEGNEHLVGTTDEPNEEVKLEEGEWVMVTNDRKSQLVCYNLRQYSGIDNNNRFITKYFEVERLWDYVIRFSDFNPNNMEETKKHILCVKDGKVVKYKG